MTLELGNFSQQLVKASAKDRHVLPKHSVVVMANGSTARSSHFLSLIDCDLFKIIVVLGTQPQKLSQAFGSAASAVSLASVKGKIIDVAARLRASGNIEIFTLLVDASCLSRQQLGEVMAAVKVIAGHGIVDLRIGYCLGRFAPPQTEANSPIRRIAPVNFSFSGWTNAPGKPIDIVVGLGYEKGKALGAVEYLEPRATWIFVPNSPERRYLGKVLTHNKELLRGPPRRQMAYDVLSPVDTYFTLLSLVSGMKRESRPILLPFGPKIYFAVALLVAITVDEAAVWFVDGDDAESPMATIPSAYSVVMSCEITTRNIDSEMRS